MLSSKIHPLLYEIILSFEQISCTSQEIKIKTLKNVSFYRLATKNLQLSKYAIAVIKVS
jgi:hypothetical protein